MSSNKKRNRSVKIQDVLKASRSISGSDDNGSISWSPSVKSNSQNSNLGMNSAPGRYGTDYFKFPETIDEEVMAGEPFEATKRY